MTAHRGGFITKRSNDNAMASSNLISQQQIQSMFLYDKDTGIFTRRHFGKRSKLAGRVGNIKTNGYLEVGIGGKKYLLHRLAWLYTYGLWPLFHIDHINGIKTDNRIANLRDVTHTVNMQNRSGGEKIGYVGRFRDGWRAQLQRNKKKATKTFKTEQECHSWLASLSAAM